MGKRSKSKRNPQKSRDAAQPSNGRERVTISKIGEHFEHEFSEELSDGGERNEMAERQRKE